MGIRMPFHALIQSPLGPILLEADETGLSGLYFTDQRDLPQVPGLEAACEVVSDPTAGTQAGRALSSAANKIGPRGDGIRA